MIPMRSILCPAAGFLMIALLAATPARAFIGECNVAMDNKTFEDNADKHEVTLRDTVQHQPITFDMGDKTLRELKPGDVVQAHGEPHVLMEITQRANWSRYSFASQSDVDRYQASLSVAGGMTEGSHDTGGDGDRGGK
jgi:hypothetical protein